MDWLTGSKNAGANRLISQLSDPARQKQASSELVRLGADAAPSLLEALRSRSPGVPALAAQILVHLGPKALPTLVEALQTAHPLIRADAAQILGRIKNPAALPSLLSALCGEFFTVRAAAASALGEIGDRSALEPLLTALKDPEPSVRAAAVVAVGRFNLPATFEGISALLLEDPKTEVRQAAARALGGTRNPATLPLLMEALHDSFWWYEREPAAADLLNAIQSIGEPAVDPLIAALADSEGTIRRFAATLLGNMRAAKAVPALGMALYDLYHEVGAAAALALGRMGAGSLDELELAARHAEPQVRQNAARGLANIDNPRSAGLLLELLNDPDPLVRLQAVPGLAAQNDPLAIAALMQTAGDRSDRELQSRAREALRGLNLEA